MTGTLDGMMPTPDGHAVTGPPLRSAAHAARPSVPLSRALTMAAAGVVLLAALGMGISACVGSAGPVPSAPTSARLITVTPSAHP